MRVHLILAGFTAAFAVLSVAEAADLNVSVLDRGGKPLGGAVVLVDSAVQGPRPTPVLEAVITQEKLRFVPAVTVVGMGARISFTNLDGWDHHVILGLMGAGGVYVDPGQNTQLRLAGRVPNRPPAGESRVLTQPGAYLLGCHIHGSMSGHVYVADTPWAKLGGDDGQALIQGLPEGPARVRVWHPDLLVDGAPVNVQLTSGNNAVSIPTQISPARKKRPAGDPYFGG